jgi:hypothetical protein
MIVRFSLRTLASRAVILLVLCFLGQPTNAQERVTFSTDVTFYGDNTEFFNPFRDGETLFGAAATMAVNMDLNEKVSVHAGIFANHRFGSENFAEQWRPVIRIELHSDHQRLIFGTLDTVERQYGSGPDRTGPHGLLPPIQKETIAFSRPYEAGLQWKLNTPRLSQDFWLNWQRLNTAKQRERFDAGINGRLPLSAAVPMAIAYQFHVVHEGGQLFDSGPVRDSWAAGPGFIVEPRVQFFDRVMLESYALFAGDVPDRAHPDDSQHGHGIFTRFSGEKNGWRGHLIIWGACDWIKTEGDENYGALRQDGTNFRATRHYGEIGLTKIFHPAAGVELEGSARIHRIEKDYNYSYRILTRVDVDFIVWTP